MSLRLKASFLVLFTAVIPAVLTLYLNDHRDFVWNNEPFHACLEGAGAMVAIILGVLLTSQRRFDELPDYLLWLVYSLFAMGILDGFHAVIPLSSPFFWTRAFATLFGGLIMAMVWIPTPRRANGWMLPLIGLMCFLGIWLDFIPNSMPTEFDVSGKFTWTARLINVVGGCGFLIAAPRFLLVGKGDFDERRNLILFGQAMMLGTAGVLFAFSNLWGPVWWLFHGLRFFSYLILLQYVFVSYERVQRQIHDAYHRLEIRNNDLAASNAELEAFSYSVSHDLRAPLRGIDGFSQALLEDYESAFDQQGKLYVRFIREGAQKMGRLIDDILKLSRLTRTDMKLQEVDLSALSREIADSLKLRDPDRAVEVTIADGLIISADLGLISVCLQNLFENGFKFTRDQAKPHIELGVSLENEETVYFVRDNGAGFSMEYSKKLFGAFQRLHTDKEFPGTGIGLATVRRVINRHGGRIWAESSVGQGATFYFTIGQSPPQ